MTRSACALALLLGACGGEDASSCPSGVRLDGQCLSARDGGVPDAVTGPRPGAACDDAAALSCAAEGPEVLACRAGAYEVVVACPGGEPCVVLPGGTSVHCGLGDTAQPVAVPDASCAAPGAASCSPDRAALLSCDGGAWRIVEACGTGLTCGRTPASTKGPGWSCPGPSACAVCK